MIYEAKVITTAIQENFGIDISLRSRRREIVDARSAVFVAMRSIGSTSRIASCFNMDHSSVVYCSKQHEDRYHEDKTKRLKHYDLYCNVYDFVTTLIKEKRFDAFDSILNVREELVRQRSINKDLNRVLSKTEKELTRAKEKIKEMNKYRTAFLQLTAEINETK